MGSSGVDLVYDGDLSISQVKKEIKKQVKEDRAYNGHRDGYSGDWQTIRNISFQPQRSFKSVDKAIDWCLDNCDKHDAIAVKVMDNRQEKWVIAGWAAE